MSLRPVFPGTVKTFVSRIQNADGTNLINVVGAGTAGSRLDALAICNSDASNARVLQFAVTVASIDYTVGEITIPAGAGTNGTTPAVDGLSIANLPWLADDGVHPYLTLEAGAILKAKSKTAVTSGQFIYLVGNGGDY